MSSVTLTLDGAMPSMLSPSAMRWAPPDQHPDAAPEPDTVAEPDRKPAPEPPTDLRPETVALLAWEARIRRMHAAYRRRHGRGTRRGRR